MENEANYDKYYSLKALVEDVLDDRGESDHLFMKYLKWAYRALVELSLDVYQQPITCDLVMDDKRVVELPHNYVDWTKIALQIGDHLKTVGVNDDLVGQGSLDECRNTIEKVDINNFPNGIDYNNYGGYYFFNYRGSNLLAYGGGLLYQGHFKINDKTYPKTIAFDSDVNNTRVFLEYISNGVEPCEDSHVSPYHADYIRKFIDHEAEKRSSQRTEASIYRFKEDLRLAERRVRSRRNNLDKKTFLNLTRKYYRLTVKA